MSSSWLGHFREASSIPIAVPTRSLPDTARFVPITLFRKRANKPHFLQLHDQIL